MSFVFHTDLNDSVCLQGKKKVFIIISVDKNIQLTFDWSVDDQTVKKMWLKNMNYFDFNYNYYET